MTMDRVGRALGCATQPRLSRRSGGPGTGPRFADPESLQQQAWAASWLREHAAPGACPRYLFLGLLFNRNADRP